MKKILSLLAICLLISTALDAQITNVSNSSTILPEFVGWNGAAFTTPKNLDLKNNFSNRNINFFTNGTAANGTSVQRMTIIGNAGPTAGFVGIGTAFTAPTNLLHLSSGLNPGYTQVTNTATGNNASDGFHFGIEANGNALIRQMENAPLYLQTNAQNRFKINRSVPYDVNGFSDSRGGYMLLSPIQNPTLSLSSGNIYDANRGAFSIFHIHGTGQAQEQGARPWWKAGITLTDNSDGSYIGLRAITTDLTETVINWSDNTMSPDDMVFRFTSQGLGSTGNDINDFRTSTDMDGRHIARFTGEGLFGLGNTFGAETIYSRPQSLLHMSYDFNVAPASEPYGFTQITYRRPLTATANIIGQGEQATDGLRMGIDNEIFNTGGQSYLNGYLRWQEQSSFIIQTEDDGTPSIESNERMRVTSVGALTANQGINYIGVPLPVNRTRISVSADGANPVTRPMSLLHLGYNTLTDFAGNGWRSWMDLGTFISSGSDNMFIGLKDEGGTDRQDAVVSWGDNQTTNGPDNMRFIFTAPDGFATGTPPANSIDGLEGMRMTPTDNQGVLTGIGGDPNANLYGPFATSINPTATLEVNSWGATTDAGGNSGLRFTNLKSTSPTLTNPGAGVLSVDADGDVIYVPASAGGGGGTVVGANNGTSLSIINPSNVVLGQELNAGSINGPAALISNREIPLNGNNIVFTDFGTNSVNGNRIGIGTYNPVGKLDIRMDHLSSPANSIAIRINNNEIPLSGSTFGQSINLYGVNDLNVASRADIWMAQSCTGFDAFCHGTERNVGISGWTQDGSDYNYGVQAVAQTTSGAPIQSTMNIGVISRASDGAENRGGDFWAIRTFGTVDRNYGLITLAQGGTENYGIHATANNGTSDWAGYFQGRVQVQGVLTIPGGNVTVGSDSIFKTQITDIPKALDIIGELKPRTYFMDTVNFTNYLQLSSKRQYGLIAQEVEDVLPELVTSNKIAAVRDSNSVVIAPEFEYKGLNYQGFIAILLEGVQEQQSEIDSLGNANDNLQSNLDSLGAVVNDLNARLTQLENCLSAILPSLCEMNQSAIQANTPEAQELVRNQLAVVLGNKETIVLDQNVPNPFAEQTVINFSIPATVAKAQLHFYNGQGKLIQSVDVAERGLGSLTVFGSDLSSGTYTYTLVADGKVVATKKMVKQ